LASSAGAGSGLNRGTTRDQSGPTRWRSGGGGEPVSVTDQNPFQRPRRCRRR
jgi:hypothetical protein